MAQKDGRMSMAPAAAGQSRDSRGVSLGGRRSSVAPGRSGQFQDPRVFKDPAFKRSAIEKVIRCLMEHGYDRAINPQVLHQPTQKDFVHWISFLFKIVVPNFEFTQGAKFEDEVPQIFKALGYPVNVTKSSLQTVGAQHSWPPLLGALAWLTDLINYSEAASNPENTWDDDQDGNKMFFDYLQKGYGLFLKATDEELDSGEYMNELEEEIQSTFDMKNAALQQDIDTLTKANDDLRRQHSELTDGDTPLQKAQSQYRDLVSDEAKFTKHIASLNEHKAKVSDKLATESTEHDTKSNELATLLAEIEQHKATVAAQEMTPADVRRMKDETAHLEGELSSLKAQREALSKQLWEEETAQQRAVAQLEGKVQQANNFSLRLHLMPASASNAGGQSHELALRMDRLESAPEELLNMETKKLLLPSLQRIKQSVHQEVGIAHDELLESEGMLARREVAAGERAEQLTSLKADLVKLEKEEKRLREVHAKELSDMKAETEALEEQIASGRIATGQTTAASQAELKALQKELDEFTRKKKSEMDRIYSQVTSSCDMLLHHKETVQAQLASLREHCHSKMDSLEGSLGEEEPSSAVEVQ